MESIKPLDFFRSITKVPRKSGDEKRIVDYLIDFAKRYGLDYHVDEHYNLIIRKEGQGSNKHHSPVILQAHTDMVYVADEPATHIYEYPLPIYEEGGYLYSQGTSLGADNGIGIAYILSVLVSETISHPPIEALFTACEEEGLRGAKQLVWKGLQGTRLINLDSEEEGVLVIGCSGGANYHLSMSADFRVPPINEKNVNCSIEINGLKGGHSGLCIDHNRTNAIILVCEILKDLSQLAPIQIGDFTGGKYPNVIPGSAKVLFTCSENHYQLIKAGFEKLSRFIRKELINTEPTMNLSLQSSNEIFPILSQEDSSRLLNTILLLPNGVIDIDHILDNQVRTSSNLGLILQQNDRIIIEGNVRGVQVSDKEKVLENIRIVADNARFRAHFDSFYPGWEAENNSSLVRKCKETYLSLNAATMCCSTIHAGLECGFFTEKCPNLDMVSFGPNIDFVHSTEERVEIKSVDRVWTFLQCLLAKL